MFIAHLCMYIVYCVTNGMLLMKRKLFCSVYGQRKSRTGKKDRNSSSNFHLTQMIVFRKNILSVGSVDLDQHVDTFGGVPLNKCYFSRKR